jgi:hypothetical protein
LLAGRGGGAAARTTVHSPNLAVLGIDLADATAAAVRHCRLSDEAASTVSANPISTSLMPDAR